MSSKAVDSNRVIVRFMIVALEFQQIIESVVMSFVG